MMDHIIIQFDGLTLSTGLENVIKLWWKRVLTVLLSVVVPPVALTVVSIQPSSLELELSDTCWYPAPFVIAYLILG